MLGGTTSRRLAETDAGAAGYGIERIAIRAVDLITVISAFSC
jgi:hypothetical protein